jgi:hypothetical protein
MQEIQFYVAKDNRKLGPFTREQLQAMLDAAEIQLSDQAWTAGHDSWKPLHVILGERPPPPEAKAGADRPMVSSATTPAYFYISTSRLICMSVISFGLFNAYWIYKNWSYLKERDGLDIMPFWRGWFAIFHFHSLLEYIKNDAKVSHPEKPDYPSGWLTFGFIAVTLCGNRLVLPGMLAFLFVLPAHNCISRINQSADNPPAYSPWSFGQVLCALFLPIVFFGTFLVVGLSSR